MPGGVQGRVGGAGQGGVQGRVGCRAGWGAGPGGVQGLVGDWSGTWHATAASMTRSQGTPCRRKRQSSRAYSLEAGGLDKIVVSGGGSLGIGPMDWHTHHTMARRRDDWLHETALNRFDGARWLFDRRVGNVRSIFDKTRF